MVSLGHKDLTWIGLLFIGMLPGAQYQLPVDQLKPMLKEKGKHIGQVYDCEILTLCLMDHFS